MTTSVTDEMVSAADDAYDKHWANCGDHYAAMRCAIEAALRSQGKVEGWRPIDTAPKDGSTVLAYSPVDGPFTSRWEGRIWQGQPWRPYKEALKANPTHWMPLPSAPTNDLTAIIGEGD